MSDSTLGKNELARTIGLTGSIAMVVGGAAGAGIFVLVRDIAALAGNAIWLAYTLAVIIAVIGVLPLVQLAAAIPRAGAGYLFASRLLSPFWGVLTSNWIVLGGASSTCVVSLTLAAYVSAYLPVSIPSHIIAFGILALFYIVYRFGLRLAMGLQLIMVAQFVFVLVMYGLGGVFAKGLVFGFNPPGGGGGFAMAIMLCFSTCLGFQVVAEMGEEIKNARRTIPLALLIGGVIIAGIYITTSTVFVTTIPPDPHIYTQLRAPLSESAALFLPKPLVQFLSLGAVAGALTALNAASMALPREWFAQARDGFMPQALSAISPKTHAPQNAITAFFILVAILLLTGRPVELYGFSAAIGILVMTAILCFAALRLPKRYPERLASAYMRFPQSVLILCTIITAIISGFFILILMFKAPEIFLVYTGWTLLIIAFYKYRSFHFTSENWQRILQIPGHDEQ
ncbi:MAG TPA: APC family permease [Candidatus Hydrogenedentes bacterium]|nr:APC family permease [Candidatus Hydrogenedentota bacterium]